MLTRMNFAYLSFRSHKASAHIFFLTVLTYVPCMHFGGDWIRQGKFEVGSKPWSPRHVNQGYCQI